MNDDDLGNYRSALKDALGRPIPNEGDLRVWLDDNLDDRRAWDGWVHVRTVREACFLLFTGRVVELSLDNDLDNGEFGDDEFGLGFEVIDFLEEQHFVHGRPRWPRDGITPHTANSAGRKRMTRALEALERREGVTVTSEPADGGRFRYIITAA